MSDPITTRSLGVFTSATTPPHTRTTQGGRIRCREEDCPGSEPFHAPRMISPKHFSGTLCGTKGPITTNRPTCPACLEAQERLNEAWRQGLNNATLAPEGTHWLVYSETTGEYALPERAGWTKDRDKAGRYTERRADKAAETMLDDERNEISLVRLDRMEELINE